MDSDEVSYLADAYFKEYKQKWEMLRLNNHAIISSQSTKPVKVTDVLKFDWDTDKKINTEDEDKLEIQRIKEKIKNKNG